MRWPLLLLLLLLAACVERRLWVRTEPAGAIVRINGEEIGPSPASWRFYQYGVVLVEVEKPGFQPIERRVRLRAPWFQKPGVDFFADIVIPYRVHDDHEMTVKLEPDPPRNEAAIDREIDALTKAARAARTAEENR